jgi:pimeloyl-ACP methyl ester carboxylesterase
MKRMWSIIGLILSLYIGLVVFLFLMQESMVYFPTRGITTTPADIGLAYEPVWLETADGVKVSGWFVPAEPARGVALFLHGNAGNISHRLDSIDTFHRLGLSVFIFDYRGYGQSEGKPSEQ